MVGLSIVLEAQKSSSSKNNIMNHHQVISKTSMIITTTKNDNKISSSSSPSSSSSSSSSSAYNNRSFMAPTFLDQCFLCHQKLLPGKDIYMYKGDRAFCSVECRCRQIFMDEEESIPKDNCSLAAIKPTSSSSSSSSSSSRHRKGSRNRAGGFAC